MKFSNAPTLRSGEITDVGKSFDSRDFSGVANMSFNAFREKKSRENFQIYSLVY